MHTPFWVVSLFGEVRDSLQIALRMLVLKEQSKLLCQHLQKSAKYFQVCRTNLLKNEFEIC